MTARDDSSWLVINQRLDEVLSLPPEQRPQWLADLARVDVSLADTLRRLLEAGAEADRVGFLESQSSPLHLGFDGEKAAGRRIGAYVLESEIGRGGMSSVWLAHRADGRFEGQVAIKFPSLAWMGRLGAERFAREGRILGSLLHPGIARLIDAGSEEGQAYLVLEYVPGESIDVWCARLCLSVEQRIRLYLQVLAAVAYAHSKLILHRDLKPSNILVDREGRVKLLDFGVAKLLAPEPGGPDFANLTEEAGRAFTPDFAAPEQVSGGEISTATDVYSAGVVLYQLLCGTHPILDRPLPPVERLRALLDTEPARLSDRVTRESTATGALERAGIALRPERLARQLRGDLDNILARALQKDPAARYATIEALADDLGRYLDHQPVVARPDTVAYRARKFVRRHRLGVGAAFVTLLALLGGIAGTTWQAIESRQARDQARLSARLAEERRLEADQQRAVAELRSRIAIADQEFVSQLFGDAMQAGVDPRMRARLDRAREMLRRRFANEPRVHALLLLQLAGRFAELDESEREAEVLAEFGRLSESTGDASLLANVACINAYEQIQDHDLKAGAVSVARGLKLLARAEAEHDWADAGFECYRADAMLAAERGETARAVERMQVWLGRLEASNRTKTRSYLASLGSLAYIYDMAGDELQALAVTRRKMQLDAALGSDQTLSAQVDVDGAALLLLDLGRLQDAVAQDVKFAADLKSAIGKGTIPATFRLSIARRALLAGFYERAAPVMRRELPQLELSGNEPFVRGITLDLAEGALLAGLTSVAQRELVSFEKRLSRGPPSKRQAVRAARVRLLLALARNAGSETLAPLRKSLDEAVTDAGPQQRGADRALSMAAQGAAALQGNDLTAARRIASQLLADADAHRVDGGTSAWAGIAQLLLAETELRANAVPQARQALQRARHEFAETLDRRHPWYRRLERLESRAG